MARLMSVSKTVGAVRRREKTVTRRLGWWTDKNGRQLVMPGDRLTLCEKVQGRKPGEPLVRLAEVEVVSVRRERLWDITDEDIASEGVPVEWFEEHHTDTGLPTPQAWVWWFCEEMNVEPDVMVTRIEWIYLPEVAERVTAQLTAAGGA
jgi:hypothetical protein